MYACPPPTHGRPHDRVGTAPFTGEVPCNVSQRLRIVELRPLDDPMHFGSNAVECGKPYELLEEVKLPLAGECGNLPWSISPEHLGCDSWRSV